MFVQGTPLEQVKVFMYLESDITENGNCEMEIRLRLSKDQARTTKNNSKQLNCNDLILAAIALYH